VNETVTNLSYSKLSKLFCNVLYECTNVPDVLLGKDERGFQCLHTDVGRANGAAYLCTERGTTHCSTGR